MLPLALLLLACADLTWDPVPNEPGIMYRVARGSQVLGNTAETSFPVGCPEGLFSVISIDAAGNESAPSWYWEGGPCAVGCPQLCTLTRPDGSCAVSLLPPGSPCCAPVRP